MVGKSRIEKGSEFLEENDEAFGKAEDRYGIPRDIVASIIGVETVYGRNQGSFRVLDSLCTLTFDYKRRADYFRTELTEFLLLLREQHLDPATVYGSFAGAIGMGQFMPSSVRKYAVDFDGDGQIDLVGSSADAIGSVANYLSSHGWVRGLPPFFSCTPDSDADMRLVTGGITTDTTFDHALRAGFIPDFELNIPGDEPLMIVDLPYRDQDGKQATEYRLGTRNFQTILNYNHSYFYASAVSDLAEEIETISMDRLQRPAWRQAPPLPETGDHFPVCKTDSGSVPRSVFSCLSRKRAGVTYQTIFISSVPTPAMPPFRKSPFFTGPTPAGVPVKTISPAFSSQNFERWLISSAGVKSI